MSLWFKIGTQKILFDSSGRVINCIDCPCNSLELIGGNCLDYCDGISRCWELVVAGVSNNLCTDCTNWNGTHILEATTDTSCTWLNEGVTVSDRHATLSICFSGNGKFALDISPSAVRITMIHDSAPGASSGYYDLTSSPFDCTGPNDFSLVSADLGCNWPSSLTLEPVSCP